MFEQPIHRPPNEFAHRPVLLPGDGTQPLHDRIWKENLNLLHGSMRYPCDSGVNAGNTPRRSLHGDTAIAFIDLAKILYVCILLRTGVIADVTGGRLG